MSVKHSGSVDCTASTRSKRARIVPETANERELVDRIKAGAATHYADVATIDRLHRTLDKVRDDADRTKRDMDELERRYHAETTRNELLARRLDHYTHENGRLKAQIDGLHEELRRASAYVPRRAPERQMPGYAPERVPQGYAPERFPHGYPPEYNHPAAVNNYVFTSATPRDSSTAARFLTSFAPNLQAHK